mgnify:CR=1 FL=1
MPDSAIKRLNKRGFCLGGAVSVCNTHSFVDVVMIRAGYFDKIALSEPASERVIGFEVSGGRELEVNNTISVPIDSQPNIEFLSFF